MKIDAKKFPILAQALEQPLLQDASVEFFPLLTGDDQDPYKVEEADVNLLLPDLTLEEAQQLPREPFELKIQQTHEDPVRGSVTFWFDFSVQINGQEPNPDGTVSLKFTDEL